MPRAEAIYLKDLLESNFDGIDKKSIKLYHYIDHMATALEKDLTSVDLTKVFPYKDKALACDENQINDIIFKLEDKQLEEDFEFDGEVIDHILKSGLAHTADKIKRLKEQLNSEDREYQRMVKELNEQTDKKIKTIRELRFLHGKSPEEEIAASLKLINPNNWVLRKFDDRYLIFTTKENLILTHRNPDSGIDIRLNFGQYEIKMDLKNNMNCVVNKYRNNINYENRFHPHIDNGGSICFGNLQESYNDYRSKFDIANTLETIHQLLSSYNASDPYVPIERFAAASGQVQPNGEVIKIENQTRYRFECDECGETWDQELEGTRSRITRECPNCGDDIRSYDATRI